MRRCQHNRRRVRLAGATRLPKCDYVIACPLKLQAFATARVLECDIEVRAGKTVRIGLVRCPVEAVSVGAKCPEFRTGRQCQSILGVRVVWLDPARPVDRSETICDATPGEAPRTFIRSGAFESLCVSEFGAERSLPRFCLGRLGVEVVK